MHDEFQQHANAGLRVRFRHEKFDWLVMRLGWSSDQERGNQADEKMLLRYQLHLPDTSRLREVTTTVSSTFCPFKDMIAWLEAIAVGCNSCSFYWDCEGRQGSMQLHHSRLTITWSGKGKIPPFEYEIDCERKQVVSAFYQALRGFVTSPEYDPIRYEQLKLGDRLAFVAGCSEEELVGRLLFLDRNDAESVFDGLFYGVSDADATEGGDQPREDSALLALFKEVSKDFPPEPESAVREGPLHPLWDRWSIDRRRTYLQTKFDHESGKAWFGTNLRTLRSPIVEDYLGWSPQTNRRPSTLGLPAEQRPGEQV